MRPSNAAMGWFVSVVAGLGLVLGLHHVGVNLSSNVVSMMHTMEQFLGQPLLPS